MRYVIIPGINGSDEDHRQTIWQAEWGAYASRISPFSWDEPVALRLTADWQLDHVGVGSAGHINSAGRLGRWDFGRALLTAFTAGTRRS